MTTASPVLAIITARGGSKGVPRKNIRNVGGKPLIAWSIEAAKKSRCIDRLILSSEDSEIIEVAQQWGCEAPFVRPAELAQDDSPGMASVFHALEILPGYDYVLLLQPTSPLRTSEDIDKCLSVCLEGAPACVSVVETDKSPSWMYYVDDEASMEPVLGAGEDLRMRQLLRQSFVLNGALYAARVDWLLQTGTFVTKDTRAYQMPRERSLDIDSEFDFLVLETLLASGLRPVH